MVKLIHILSLSTRKMKKTKLTLNKKKGKLNINF